MLTLPVMLPMKAADDLDRALAAFLNDNYWCERKYDGSRYLISIEEDESGNKVVKVTSRTVSKVTGLPVDKTENVPHLVKYFMRFPAGTQFDGEIITHENCTSSEVTEIMGAKPDKAIARQKEKGFVNYVVFDITYYEGRSLCDTFYHLRRDMIENLIVSKVDEHVFISQVWKTNKREAYEEIVANGGEGVILKNIYGKYFPDKRPLDVWLKVKKYMTRDVVVIGFDESERDYDGDHPETWAYWYNPSTDGKYMADNTYDTKMLVKDGFVPVKKPWFMGWIGAIRIGQYVNGVLTDVGQVSSTTLNDELKEWFSTHREEAVGKVIEIGAMEQIKKTKKFRHSRFKQFRDDKYPEECIYGEC